MYNNVRLFNETCIITEHDFNISSYDRNDNTSHNQQMCGYSEDFLIIAKIMEIVAVYKVIIIYLRINQIMMIINLNK